MYHPLAQWPAFSHDPADIQKLYGKSPLGLDLEWDAQERPTILGLSAITPQNALYISVPFDAGLPYFAELLRLHPDTQLLGHNVIGADMFVLQRYGITLKLENMLDTIVYHWLVNMNLCKAGEKTEEGDDGDKRGRGFMNLGAFASMYTDLPYWKDCRGAECSGPCPYKKCPNYRPESVYHYNALDAGACVMAFPQVKRIAQLRGVEKLYPMHRDLMLVLAEMQDYGVRVNVPYVNELRSEFEQEKRAIEGILPFNPDSPKQVMDYFHAKSIHLDNAQEQTIRDAVEEFGRDDDPSSDRPELVDLTNLLDYKELGNGVDRWFQPQYRDKNGWLQGFLDVKGWVHPHLGIFTSSTRMQCTSPNLQNVSKRRRSRKICECGKTVAEHNATTHAFKGLSLGKRVREAIIAPDGWYIVRADLSNAENRVVLHRSGYTIDRGVDLHDWVRQIAGLTEDMEVCKVLGGPRDAAKQIQHAGNMHEGLQLKTLEELRGARIKKEISVGARVVYSDWTFCKKIVTFTGAPQAQRIFEDKSFESRKKALEISERYFERFPNIRKWQREVSAACERENVVRTPHGYVLLSYGPDPNDRMKIAQGVQQQSPVAHITKLALLRMWRRWKRQGNYRPVLQVHDECLAYVRDDVDPRTAMAWIKEDMEIGTIRIPGLLIPAEPSYGPNWRKQST